VVSLRGCSNTNAESLSFAHDTAGIAKWFAARGIEESNAMPNAIATNATMVTGRGYPAWIKDDVSHLHRYLDFQSLILAPT
jgi:hypothetical protein